MCNICVFAGTTEGRELVEFLAGQPVQIRLTETPDEKSSRLTVEALKTD